MFVSRASSDSIPETGLNRSCIAHREITRTRGTYDVAARGTRERERRRDWQGERRMIPPSRSDKSWRGRHGTNARESSGWYMAYYLYRSCAANWSENRSNGDRMEIDGQRPVVRARQGGRKGRRPRRNRTNAPRRFSRGWTGMKIDGPPDGARAFLHNARDDVAHSRAFRVEMTTDGDEWGGGPVIIRVTFVGRKQTPRLSALRSNRAGRTRDRDRVRMLQHQSESRGITRA